jgi:ribosomal-protein-serine acetyltransferase
MRFEQKVDDELALRLLEPVDAPELASLVTRNAARLGRWLPFAREPYGEAEALQFIALAAQNWAQNRGAQTGIIWQGRLAGMIGVHDLDRAQGHLTLGYWIAEDGEGKGLVTRSARAILAWAFGPGGLMRAEIRAAEQNQRSRRTAERLGFRQEGILRAAARVGDGWLDMVVYGMTREDWASR